MYEKADYRPTKVEKIVNGRFLVFLLAESKAIGGEAKAEAIDEIVASAVCNTHD